MHVFRSGSDLIVHAPAKLNLSFEVLARRGDGYHEVETLVCPIDLFDTLYFKEHSSGKAEFECQASSARQGDYFGSVPNNGTNLAVRAVERLRERSGIKAGYRLRLVKRIPAAAGLGGGSSDAAAALVAANRAWKLNWPTDRLQSLGAELGSDVPLFFERGATLCRGRGERVERIDGLGQLHFVVVRPPAGLATAAVYGACRVAAEARPSGPLIDALKQGNLGEAGRLLFNRLESAAENLSPWIDRLRRAMARTNCLGYRMSGSGSSFFGLCRHQRHARQLAARLEAEGLGVAFAVRGCC